MIKTILDQLLLTWRLIRDSRVPLWSKAIPLIAVAYVLSPLDLIPDFIIGLGQLDDLGIIVLSVRLFESVVPEYIVAEHRLAIARRNQPLDTIDSAGYRVLDSKEKRKNG